MKQEEVAATLAELGNTHRLEIFRFLVRAGRSGASVGAIKQALGIPDSTLSHHLTRMKNVNLISQQRQGRTLICIPNFKHLETAIDFLKDKCCEGEGEKFCPAPEPQHREHQEQS